MWLVKVWSPDDPSQSRCFCALSSDEASAAILVREYGDFDDGLIVQPFAQIFDDEAIVEAYGLPPGGVMPWPANVNSENPS
jgi:hypothetical protein